ncbi:TetR/AcrR family transcriptional regulator [Camelliibacillus cellulosilyticus]|uniref:TetR/AcrR family transcriptional regulator n=1 Tax=Camelliibacillus cellulosilyticus TaxID=2174486 RepID=A0ABV9GNM0_9BACL
MDDKNHVEDRTGTRRRGHDLEVAILQAAWRELQDVGYSRLTMEGVAARAKTSKTAVYRRWSNRSELVIAAIRQYGLFANTVQVPDTGALRSDVLALLRQRSEQLKKIRLETVHGLLAEGKGDVLDDLLISRQSDMHEANLKVMQTILEKAAKRGEIIQLNQISPRIMTLPIDLERHELFFAHEPVSEETLIEIVDDIFLPLILKSNNK